MTRPRRPARREVLKAIGGGTAVAAVAALTGVPSAEQRTKSTVFVLVHPAWHGAWCWKKVVPLLEKRGHTVATVTLTGLGERRHLARADVGLDLHVTDVVNLLKFEDLHDVVLVGHSSSGAVITGVANRAPEHLAHVVYLDAFVPEDGQGVLDLLPPDRRRALEALVNAEGDGWLLPRFASPPWETIVRDMWGVTDAGDVRWMLERLTPTPIGHFRDAVQRKHPAAAKLPSTYIRCRGFPSPRFDQHADMARRTPGWHYRELATSHHPAVTAPADLVNVLVRVRS
jgi:pimeloyl-ACP methyl ester carboxylesterase